MTSATQEVVSASGWSIELEDRISDLRDRALTVCLVAVAVLGLLLLRVPASLLSVEHTLIGTFLVLSLVGVTFWVRSRSYLQAAWLLFLGCVAMLGLVLVGTRYPPLVCLLILPVAAGTILISIPAGLVTSFVFSAALLIWPGLFPGMDEGLTVITIAGIWIVEGALLMTLKPLVNTVQWAWRGYERSLESLEQARDYQQQLFETLEDLTEANVQLTRLNRLAQALRQAADNERRTKEQFVANVSHELRTPLNMIVGFCEMMLESPETYGDVPLPPTLLADLDVVLRNSQHLSDMVDDVLDLSQIEAGQMALVREHVAFEEIVTSAVTAVSPLFRSKSLTLDVEIATDLPSVFCDRIRIREVLLNLLSNAGRFTEIGGVTVKAWREQDDLVVSVTDTGPGIPEGKRERLFRPFEQLDATIRRRYGGTGLGLSISKSFVELHEGKVWVESQEGQGTTFFFRLPFAAPAPLGDSYMRWVDPYNPYEPRSRPSRLPQVQIQPRWVVVEQGTSMQRILARHLEGIDFVPVTSLPAAMDALRETPSQALLVNELDVGAALAKLHDELTPPYSIPVIICSVPGVEQAINGLGVSGYLVKPIAREVLLSALSHLARPVETVMLIDDEREALMLYRRMLSSADRPYRVLRARNGRQAIEILQQQLPDVILLDLMMPEMDGFEFLRLRKGTAWEDVPVILISARDPLGHPIVSDALAVTVAGGLSVNQILTSIRMFTSMLAAESHMSPGEDGTPTLRSYRAGVV
jgi:signal transduction histidine kinase/CheY-like chemotaxis protein